MARKVIDCREFPSDINCTVTIAADTDDELLDVAVLHAVDAHDHEDTPELRNMLKGAIKESALA